MAIRLDGGASQVGHRCDIRNHCFCEISRHFLAVQTHSDYIVRGMDIRTIILHYPRKEKFPCIRALLRNMIAVSTGKAAGPTMKSGKYMAHT